MGRSTLVILFLCLQWPLITATSAQPSSQFAALELRLLEADEVSLELQVTAIGAVQATVEGMPGKTATGDIALIAQGVFAGQDIDLIAEKTEQCFKFGNRFDL